jgi:DNA-binding Lrp family transcriptional regulator
MPQDEIVEYLSGQYPNKPTQRQIAEALGKSVSTVNEQLTLSLKKGMISSTGTGKNKRYVAAPQVAKALLDQMRELRLDNDELRSDLARMQNSLDEMKEKLESSEPGLEALVGLLNNPDSAVRILKEVRAKYQDKLGGPVEFHRVKGA